MVSHRCENSAMQYVRPIRGGGGVSMQCKIKKRLQMLKPVTLLPPIPPSDQVSLCETLALLQRVLQRLEALQAC